MFRTVLLTPDLVASCTAGMKQDSGFKAKVPNLDTIHSDKSLK